MYENSGTDVVQSTSSTCGETAYPVYFLTGYRDASSFRYAVQIWRSQPFDRFDVIVSISVPFFSSQVAPPTTDLSGSILGSQTVLESSSTLDSVQQTMDVHLTVQGKINASPDSSGLFSGVLFWITYDTASYPKLGGQAPVPYFGDGCSDSSQVNPGLSARLPCVTI